MNINSSISGPFTLLKNGCPMVIVVSSTASEKIGNTVPHKVTNAISRKRIFWPRKAASRDKKDSKEPRLFRVSYRSMKITSDAKRVSPMIARKIHPMVDSAKECTEGTGPPLLINIPNCANVKLVMIRTIFHIRNMPLLFCTMIECTKAVIASHGIRAEFSTGSHAQYPPHPKMV
jgi:hypothetical protein